MNLKDARTVSQSELFDRRKQAVMLWKKGMPMSEIAPIVGVHRNAISRWIAIFKKEGMKGLKPGKAGRPVGSGLSLSPEQQKEIQRLLVDKMPDQMKLPFALWTRAAVKQLIGDRLGFRMPIRTVGHYLKIWGFTPQKPVKRAYERCDASVKRWLENDYPAIARKAQNEGRKMWEKDMVPASGGPVLKKGICPRLTTPG